MESDELRPDVIFIEITWEELNFVYDFGYVVDYYEWNAGELKYKPVINYEAEVKGWNKTQATFTIKNRSNHELWTGCTFDKNDTEIYENVDVEFNPKEVKFESAVGKTEDEIEEGAQTITMEIKGDPVYGAYDKDNPPALGIITFYVSFEPIQTEITTATTGDTAGEEDPDGEHVCHFVYDQFGRLVCTGCNKVKHEYCIDEDEDGLCDECGLERDFCPDCHVGGTCRCT